MRIGLLFMVVFAVLPRAATAQEEAEEATRPEAATPWIELRIHPLVDLFTEAWRATEPPSPYSSLPVEGEAPEPLPGLGELDGGSAALAAARALHDVLGSPLAWGPLLGRLEGCADADAWAESLQELPEESTQRGRTVELRGPALEFAEALAMVEAEFRERFWPAREARLKAAMQRLQGSLLPKANEVWGGLSQSLDLGLGPSAIPVYLCVRQASPGAVTVFRQGGGGLCFVGVDVHSGPGMLEETVVHESLHALDILTPHGRGAFEGLRRRMKEARVDERDRDFRNTWHTLMFVAAGEAIRRQLDPAHVHYGERSRLYGRMARISEAVLGPWGEFLDGACEREAALDLVVEQAWERSSPR